MFDANAGRQASTDKIEARSNRIAANIEDRLKELSLDDQEALMDRLDAVVASTDTTKSFVTGTYAQNSAGQPAQALGAGGSQFDPTQITSQQALTALAAHEPRLGPVLQRLALGLQNPNTPGALVVNQNGEFAELETARREIATKEAARAEAETKLAEERDESKDGSLAKQLKDAKAAQAPGGKKVVEVDKVVTGLEKLRDDFVANITAPAKIKVKGKDKAVEAINKEIAKVKS